MTTALLSRRVGPVPLQRLLRVGLAGLPVIFAVPILVALVQGIANIVAQGHPFFGDISGTATDARAITLGSPLYQDPAAGYTPLVYPPVMTLLSAGLDELKAWDGWTVTLSIAADVTLITVGTRLALGSLRGTAVERTAAVAGAVGIGAMAFWLMAFVPFNFAYSPRPDQLAWAFALVGLVLLPGAAGGSRRAQIGALLLLSAAIWTKQTTSAALLAAVVWMSLAAIRGRVRARTVVLWTLALVGLNALVFGVLELATGGWAGRFIVEFPDRRAHVVSTWRSIGDLAESVAVPAALAAFTWWAAFAARRRGARWPEGTPAVATVLLLFIVIDVPAAVWFREAQGAVHNMFVGIGWAAGLLLAAGWGLARERLVPLLAAAGAIAALFVASESGRVVNFASDTISTHIPPKSIRAWAGYEPVALRRYAAHHLVYHPAYPGIGASRASDLYPGSDNIEALLWSGVQPRRLVDAFLRRRFDLVYLFENDTIRGDRDGYGRWEANYLWKLNEVIKAKYRPVTGPRRALIRARIVFVPLAPFYSPGPYERRPGADPAPWMSRCFGPFRVGGGDFRIAAGGGFWCHTGGALRLVATPARLSEIRDDDFRASGREAVAVRFARPGLVRVSLGSWHVTRSGRGGRVVIPLPAGRKGALSIVASQGSRAEVRLVRA
ncbi:MAG: hypothetical protein E6G00_11210 [Actinobacteria bacterium]|nr:MAG: hypothetical protein E6G00_11210 [Actinomycetota bacterium]